MSDEKKEILLGANAREVPNSIKFPTGMKENPSPSLADFLMTQRADNLGGDPETITLEALGKLLGVGEGSGNPSTDPIFNTVTISKWLKVGESITINDLIFRIFRDGLKTYIRAEDLKNPEAEIWIDLFAGAFTRLIATHYDTPGWQQGIAGGSLWNDETGNSHLEVDYAYIRKKATFVNLVIQQLTAQAGQVIITPTNMKIGRVEELDQGYKCYAEDGDLNNFIVYDQARCQKFTLEHQKYYWRLVIAVGADYCILSKTDQDGNGDVPEAGDEIVLFGHRDDKNKPRQSAIMLDAASDQAPAISIYMGINSYDLTGKRVGVFGRDPLDSAAAGIFVQNGRFENIMIGPGCTGLDNFAEYDKLINDINKAVSKSVDIMPDPAPAFITDKDGNTTPDEITIRVSENNFNSDLGGYRRWYYLSSDGFKEIEGENQKTLVITRDKEWWAGKSTLSVMYEVELDGEKYSDVASLIKVSDGINGAGGYIAVLDNPYVGIASDYNGQIKDGQLGENGRAKTGVVAYAGTTLLSPNPNPGKGQYKLSIKKVSGCTAALTQAGGEMYILDMFQDMASVTLTVNFEGAGVTMDLVFNCSKTFDGALSSEEIKGEPGEAAYSLDLDNDVCIVSTQPDGSGGYWGDNAKTTAMVTKGGKDISSKYNFSTEANPDTIDYLATNNGKTVQVKGMEEDDGFILFTCMPKNTMDPDTINAPTLQKRFNISKNKQGEQGQRGPGGYVWIVYADDEAGTGISLTPEGKKYIGLAHDKEVPNPPLPLNPADYQFSLLTGEGVPGPPGSDRFIWIKFSTTHPITSLSQVTNDGSAEGLRFIGFSYNQVNQEEDTFPPGEEQTIDVAYYNREYEWSEYKGKDGIGLQVQYSKDGNSNWHYPFRVDDIFMRQKMDDGVTWSDPMRIVGEAGQDGTYVDYQFAKNTSMETPPTSGWQDAPPKTSGNEFLWMRKGTVEPPATEVPADGWSTPVVLTGPSGASYWIVPDTRFINMLNGSPNPPKVRFTAKRGSVADGVTGWSLGYWRTAYSKDNQKTWTTIKSWTSQVPYIDVDIDPSWTNLRAELYFDQGFVNICDSEVVLIQDVSGIPGESNYVIDLDNEVGSTNTYSDGSGGYYGNNMLTRLRVFYGTENVTSQATVTVSADSGITFTRTNNSEYVQVQVTGFTGSNMTGSVIFNVSSASGAFPSIQKMFKVIRVPQGERGPEGDSISVQFSVNGTSGWHYPFVEGDIYMRQKVGSDAWSDAIRVVGEQGQPGKDGESGGYTEFQFSIGKSRTSHSDIAESSWTDGPQSTTVEKPFAWMRSRTVDKFGSVSGWTYGSYGAPGNDGADGLPGTAYWLSTDCSSASIRDDSANPATVTATAHKGEGGVGVTDYSCYWYVAVSYDYMKNWTVIKSAGGSATTKYTYTLAKSSTKGWPTNIRFSAFFDPDGTKMIDTEDVPVINNDLNDVTTLDYLKHALQQKTEIDGGLISTTYIKVGYSPSLRDGSSVPDEIPSDWVETGGMYGGSTLAPGQGDVWTIRQFRNRVPRFYSGGDFEKAKEALKYATTQLGADNYDPPADKVTFAVSDSGILYAQNAFIEGTVMASGGKIGNLTIDSDGLAYNQVTENGKTYYKSKLYNGGLVYRENWNATDSDWDRQIAIGTSVIPSSAGIRPMLYGKVKQRGSYDTTTFMYLSITGGTRNFSVNSGPQAIRVQEGDIHINKGYVTYSGNSYSYYSGINGYGDVRIGNGWVDIGPDPNFSGAKRTEPGGINLASQRAALIFNGLRRHSFSSDRQQISIGNDNNMVVLYGGGSNKIVNIEPRLAIGSWFFIMSWADEKFWIYAPWSSGEYFIIDDLYYKGVSSAGHDIVFVIKVDSNKWIASQMPKNWLSFEERV